MKNITFINAGAGSGKTYSLTDELYRNINENVCRGDQVLLTTFTKKAAKEIKLRAHTKLLEHGKVDDAILLQNAYIGTVHSVGYHLIKKFCYQIGLSPNIKELSPEDTDFFFSQAISSVPTVNDLDRLAFLSEQFQFQKMDDEKKEFDPEKWKDHIQTIINEARKNKIDDLTESGLSYIKSIKFNQDIFGIDTTILLDINQIKSNFDSINLFIETLPDYRNKGIKDNAQKLKTSINSKDISYSTLLDIHAISGEVIKKDPTNRHAANLSNILVSFYQSEPFLNDLSEYTRLIFKIASECITAFKDFKRVNGLVDYTDMETYFLELLNLPEVQAELKQSIKLVMVDEFQDSNPIQLSIFLKLAEFVDQSIWVGDPKQAIYGFNGSDPILVNKLLEVFYEQNESNRKLRLLKNSWRSRVDIVTIINKMFEVCLEDQASEVLIHKNDILGNEGSIQMWINEKFGENDCITLPARDTIGLIPTRNDRIQGFEGIDGNCALNHWHFNNSINGPGNQEQFNYYLAQRIKGLIAKDTLVYDKTIKKTRSLRPSDIAVLCRVNKDVVLIANELIKNGIEVAASVDGLSNTAEFRLLINILNYIADSANSLAITEILLLIKEDNAISAESLLEKRLEFLSVAPIRNNADAKAYYDYLLTWGKNHPFIQKLDAFVKNSKHLSVPELIEKTVAELELTRHISAWGNAEQRKANIQQLILYAHAYDDYCVKLSIASSLIGFVQWLKSDKEKNNQAASINHNAVNVLTYHKAKGLEWHYVILSSLTYDYNYNSLQKDFFTTSVKMSEKLDIENPLENRYINFSFWPFGAKGKIMGYEDIIQESEAYKESQKNKIQETKRLLYVGMTRARDYLTTTSFKDKESLWFDLVNGQQSGWSLKAITKANSESKIFDLFGQGIEVNYQVIRDDRAEFSCDYETSDYKAEAYFEKEGSKPQDNPKYVSPSKLKRQNEVTVRLLNDFQHRIIVGKIKDESILGNCLHDILYLWPTMIDEPKIASIIERHNLEGLIDKTDVSKALDQLRNYIKELAPINIYREMPLQMAKEGKIYLGSADLVLEFDDRLYLIDYKSYPGKVEDIFNPLGNHFAGLYAGQLNSYSEMLESAFNKKVDKKMIYYSVLGKMVELC